MSEQTLTLGGVELNPEFPFTNAPGAISGTNVDRLFTEFIDLAQAPGAMMMLGVTIPEKPGNEVMHGSPVDKYIRETGLMYNSMGLPNVGIEKFAKLLPAFKMIAEDHGKELGVSLAPLTKEPYKEWIQMGEVVLNNGLVVMEFNAGCPNIFDEDGNPKQTMSLVPDFMGEQLELTQEGLGTDFVGGAKLSPAPVEGFTEDFDANADSDLLVRQAEVINAIDMLAYAAIFNTFGGQVPKDKDGKELPLSVPNGAGGVSGPGVARVVRAQTESFLKHLDEDKEVVSAGGIGDGQELADRLAMDRRIKLGSAVTPLWRGKTKGAGATRLAEEYAHAS